MKIPQELIRNAVTCLYGGGILLHPTETCYGLACDVFSKSAVQKLYVIKKMPAEKPVSILVASLEEAMKYGEFSSLATKLALKYWPGPLTIIVPRTKNLPEWINPGSLTVGIRISSHRRVKEILQLFSSPITTTSANVHGLKEAYNSQDVFSQSIVPDFVIDEGEIPHNPPSTILEVNGENCKIFRQGSVKIPI